MTLTLSTLRCPDAVPPEIRRITGGELRIGRGPDNDWIMPDPERMLSKKHCVIAFRNGAWAIADTSTNGTFLNREAEPLGQIRPLSDGDRIRLGTYEIEVRIADEPGFGAGLAGQPASRFGDPFGDDVFASPPMAPETFTSAAFGNDPLFGGGLAGQPASRFGDPFGDDVFASPPMAPETFTSAAFGNDPLFGGAPPSQSVTMPNRFDPLAPLGEDDFFAGPTQPDHSPSFSDAFKPPPVAGQILPDDDWDLGFPSATGVASPAPEPPAPSAFAPPPAATPSPFEEAPFAPRPVTLAPPLAVAAPQPPPLTPAASSPAPETLLAAFLEGAGMTGTRPEDPAATMHALGAAFRAAVSGIRQTLIARASIKSEFRIEQTMIRARGNNPLKFSANDDDALGALLGLGRRVDMPPEAAIAETLRDMRLHELATMAAMQGAVHALLAQLDPARLRSEAEQGGLSVLPAQKKARAFEAYEKLHESVTRALADDFDSVFGKSFARAYETALQDISAKDLT